MPRKILKPTQLNFQPRPTYPYSPGARGGDLVYTAGQVAWGSDGNIVGVDDIEKQTRQTPMAEDTMLIEIEAIAHIGE